LRIETIATKQPAPKWFIDLSWYQQNNRSFLILARSSLCAKCREQLSAKGNEIPASEILSTIKKCCSGATDFISDRLPIMESVFRIFLANGNQPLGLDKISEQLRNLRGGDIYHTTQAFLSRLLKDERYYGLRQAPD